MLLCKFSSGHVESSFDNIAKNFPVKTQVLLSKSKKRRKTNCSRVFFWPFSCVHLDYCFDTPDYFFCQNQKKLTESPKKDVISINHFHHFFSKFVEDTWKALLATCQKFFCQKLVTFAQKPKITKQLLFSPKKPQNVRCTHRLQLWEIWKKVPAKIPIISLNDQKLWAKFLHSRETS